MGSDELLWNGTHIRHCVIKLEWHAWDEIFSRIIPDGYREIIYWYTWVDTAIYAVYDSYDPLMLSRKTPFYT